MSGRGAFNSTKKGGINFESFIATLPNINNSHKKEATPQSTASKENVTNSGMSNNFNQNNGHFENNLQQPLENLNKSNEFNQSTNSCNTALSGPAGRGRYFNAPVVDRQGYGTQNNNPQSTSFGPLSGGSSGATSGRGGDFTGSGRDRPNFNSQDLDQSNSNYGSSGHGGYGAFQGRGGSLNETKIDHSSQNDDQPGTNFGSSNRGSFSGSSGRGAFNGSRQDRLDINNQSSNDYRFSNRGSFGRSGRGNYQNNQEFGSMHLNDGNLQDDNQSYNNYGSSNRGSYGSGGRGGRGGNYGSSRNDGFAGNFEDSYDSKNQGSNRDGGYGNTGRGRSSGMGSSGRGGFDNNEYNNDNESFERGGFTGRSGRGNSNINFGDRQPRREFNDGPERDGDNTADFLDGFAETGPKHGTATHVPVDRSVDTLFEEDSRNNMYYSQVLDQDEDIDVEGTDIIVKYSTWPECEFSKELMANIKTTGYVQPRNIQAYTMPLIVEGKDVKAQAETGSGKTAAFLLPIIDDIIINNPERKNRSPIAIIISPTRELALQTHEQARKFAYNTGVTAAKCYGQYKISENLAELDRGCDILSSTPGRLKSFVENGDILLQCLKYFILDEADELFNGSFIDIIRECMTIGGAPPKEKRVNLLFSATFPNGVEELASEILKEDYVTVLNKSANGANRKVDHLILQVDQGSKNRTVIDMLLKEKKMSEEEGKPLRRTLVFVAKKAQADILSLMFCESGLQALSLNGDRPQKLREEALNDFRAHKISVLIATDVCARGIDIKDLDHVINVDLPKEYVTFVHRVGRTGRLHAGFATSFYDPSYDRNLKEPLVDLLNISGKEIPPFLS
uniref:RNA helicase n=1 Tax=Parastrongyloides trichosuri TaxID=131310 RepID=A0A0N4ZF18_PARTI